MAAYFDLFIEGNSEISTKEDIILVLLEFTGEALGLMGGIGMPQLSH
jgi:hypothetical protein